MIQLLNLSISQGGFSLNQVSLTVPAGRYGVLMGPTGSGKTTLLESIAGLRATASGSICLDGRDVTSLPPAQRGIGYVPQDAALFPNMTVAENLAFALTIRRTPDQERITDLAKMLNLSPLLERFPRNLSGGEKQRVALGRALAFRPGILLLDEPLGSLDPQTHQDLMRLLKMTHERENVTILHVTHHRIEAQTLGEICFEIKDGHLNEVALG